MVDERLFAVSEPPFVALFMVYVLSLGLAVGQIIQMVVRARTWAPRLDRLGAVVGLFFAALISLETVHQSEVWLDHVWQLPLAILVYFLAAIVPYTHWWLSKRDAHVRAWSSYMLRGTLAVLCALSAGWARDRYHQLNVAWDELGFIIEAPGEVIPLDRYFAVTDVGQRLPLYGWRVADAKFREFSMRSALRLSLITDAAIPRATPDYRANCHGWVFADGRFLLKGNEVEQILQDNGYASTDSPQADDLVIYRNEAGQIMHTGLIRGVLTDGTVMVESKFGVGGRYLHQPGDQPYARDWSYYRSARQGHCVTIERAYDAHVSTPNNVRSADS